MATTQLFVELLINGFGVVVWLVFLFGLVFNLPLDAILFPNTALVFPAVLAIAYVLGIVIDRAGRGLFRPLDFRNRDEVFGISPDPPAYDRELYIWDNSQPLKDHAIYIRSRLRVCRSWVINFALIATFSLGWSWKVKMLALSKALVFSILCLLFSFVTFLVWKKLSKDYYQNIKSSYEFLRRNEGVNSRTA